MNRTNIERVTLPTTPSVSSGDLVHDVRLTSVDVRSDVTTTDHKTFSFSFSFSFPEVYYQKDPTPTGAVVFSGGQSGLI